jgi:hypothetical protein
MTIGKLRKQEGASEAGGIPFLQSHRIQLRAPVALSTLISD